MIDLVVSQPPTGVLVKRPSGGVAAPLAPAQRRFWLLDQILEAPAAYHCAQMAVLRGALDVPVLCGALQALVDRHVTYRTVFLVEAGAGADDDGGNTGLEAVRQHALSHWRVPIGIEDCSDPGLEPGSASRRVREIACAPFDLRAAPAVRFAVLRISADEHWLVKVVHHILEDGQAQATAWRELAHLYHARLQRRAANLPPPADFQAQAMRQHEALKAGALDHHRQWWHRTLEALPLLELPTDRPRTSSRSQRGGVLSLTLDPEVTQGLGRLAARTGTTRFTVLLASVFALMSRYSGQRDFALGVPVACRSLPEQRELMGCLVNTVPVRLQFDDDPGFETLLQRLHGSMSGAVAHADLPFEDIAAAAGAPTGRAGGPGTGSLFSVIVNKEDPLTRHFEADGLEADVHLIDSGLSKFDLSFDTCARDGVVEVRLEYAADLFDASTIERLAGHWQVLLEGIVADAATPLSRLPLLTPAEREQLLVNWNDTAQPFPSDRCMHELVQQQVQRAPSAVAVRMGEQQLSYAELNAHANRLAHRLRAMGVGPDSRVAVCLERGIDLMVALLAVLKAGGAYVPLDPEYPAARLAFMLEDAEPQALVTHSQLLGRLPDHALPTVCVDRDAQGIAAQRGEDLPVQTTPESLACLIYTSGSTGTPKAVMVPHRAIARLVCHTDYVQLGPSDVVAQAANASFDAMTFEVWGAWAAGAQLAVLPKDRLLMPSALAEELKRYRVSTLFLTTALFNEIIHAYAQALAGVRQVLFGGEACDPNRVRQACEEGGIGRLLHVYGPTECTTFATWHEVLEVPAGERTVPIGRPIANTTAFVLDEHLQPVPVGVPGELFLGGPGLAMGYWRRPELSAERFVAPSWLPGQRLYRTGDRFRWRADGQLEFIGRLDGQFKLRGHRIEPGEVEAELAREPGVTQPLAMRRDDLPGGPSLVAYVLAEGIDGEAIRRRLRQRLPDYMVPAAVVVLSCYPLTPNGKVDRHRLPTPTPGPVVNRHGLQAPVNELEQTLAKVWSDLLGVAAVDRHDNFFDLGGHSLLAAQAVARIEEACGQRPTLRSFFRHPTVASMAACLQPDG